MSTNKGWIIVGLIVAALIGGIGGFVVGKLTGDEKVGYIDLEKIMTDFPAYKDATSILRGEQVELEMKLQEESKGKTEEEKQKLLAELQEQLVAKDKELAERVEKELRDAVKKVAADKNHFSQRQKRPLFRWCGHYRRCPARRRRQAGRQSKQG